MEGQTVVKCWEGELQMYVNVVTDISTKVAAWLIYFACFISLILALLVYIVLT